MLREVQPPSPSGFSLSQALSGPKLQVAAKTTQADPRGRIAPNYQPIGEHYIFYYGGRDALSYPGTFTCDKKANAAFLFDINTLTWTDEFTPNEGTYEIPLKITGLIGSE